MGKYEKILDNIENQKKISHIFLQVLYNCTAWPGPRSSPKKYIFTSPPFHKNMSETKEETKLWCYSNKDSWSLEKYKSLNLEQDKNNKELTILTLLDETTLRVLTENTFKHNTSHDLDFKDVTHMDDLDEAPMLHLFKRRFESQNIYTNIGNVLISINPYATIEGLYDMPPSEQFNKQPHVFDISQRAFLQLNETHGNQVILVNGESGAGKTEATKKMLSHLVYLNASSKQEDGSTLHEAQHATDQVEDLVMASNEIFESFGNAATVNNRNSSRFGKFLQLKMCQNKNLSHLSETDRSSYYVCGVSATQFLLETSRLALQAPGESNFHILYQLVAGATAEERVKFRLCPNCKDYSYLRTRDFGEADDSDDEPEDNTENLTSQFQLSIKCLKRIGFQEKEINNILKTLSGILALGNVQFTSISEEQECAQIQDTAWLDTASSLLGWGTGLSHVFTHRSTAAGGGVGRGRRSSGYSIPLTPTQASAARDGLCKILYSSSRFKSCSSNP